MHICFSVVLPDQVHDISWRRHHSAEFVFPVDPCQTVSFSKCGFKLFGQFGSAAISTKKRQTLLCTKNHTLLVGLHIISLLNLVKRKCYVLQCVTLPCRSLLTLPGCIAQRFVIPWIWAASTDIISITSCKDPKQSLWDLFQVYLDLPDRLTAPYMVQDTPGEFSHG